MISNWWYILISLPITIFLYLPYVSFLEISPTHYLVLLSVLYLILSFDLTADRVFRNSLILMLLNAVSAAGRTIIYLFMAIVLITGPIYDIHNNILQLIEETRQKGKPKDSKMITKFKHDLYHLIDSHIDNHLLASVKPLCQTADNWIKYQSQSATSDICGNYSTRTHTIITRSDQLEKFLYDLFNFGTYYSTQRNLVFVMFLYCTYYLTKVSLKYREDMSYKNIFVTSTVSELDRRVREPTTSVEKTKHEIVGVLNEDDEDPPAERIFKCTLPLTSLERKQYIMVDHYQYLGSEVIHLFRRLFKFSWILFLSVSIIYFDIAIVHFLLEENPKSSASVTVQKMVRLSIAFIYMLIALLCICLEPFATRLHQQLLELFYPRLAERRARMLMIIIELQRKSFIQINRLNIFLRFNKTGNFWTATKSFVEDSSLADCLGRPSGLFCSICEREAVIPKEAQRCSTYSCNCVYCNECYEQIRFVCLCCNKKYDETMVVHIHPNTENNAEG